MDRRIDLHNILIGILGSKNVYFQPPPSVHLKYPCIIYERTRNSTRFADNIPYSVIRQYTITVIDSNPDSEIPDRIAGLSMCTMDRTYTADNLNHYVFNIYH